MTIPSIGCQLTRNFKTIQLKKQDKEKMVKLQPNKKDPDAERSTGEDNENDEELHEQNKETVLVDCEWLSDNDDEELQNARRALRNSYKNKKRVVNEQENSQGQEQETHRSGEGVDEAGQEDEATAMLSRFSQFDVQDGEEYPAEDFESDDEWSCNSTDGSNDDHAVRRKSRWTAFDPNAEKIKFALSMTFRSPKEFKEALTRESIQSQKEIHLVRNTKTQTRARCVRKSYP